MFWINLNKTSGLVHLIWLKVFNLSNLILHLNISILLIFLIDCFKSKIIKGSLTLSVINYKLSGDTVNIVDKKGLRQWAKLQDFCDCDCDCSGGKTKTNPTLQASLKILLRRLCSICNFVHPEFATLKDKVSRTWIHLLWPTWD